MKTFPLKRCLFICCLIITTVSFSQTVKFSYDQDGNRISRIIVIQQPKSTFPDSVSAEINGDKSRKNLDDYEIKVFPNPTADIINIQCKEIDESLGIDIYLFSVKGESIKKLKLKGSSQTIDLTNYSVGIYYLKIQLNNSIESWKIIKN